MRCHICDVIIENPTQDPRTKKYDPCGECHRASQTIEFVDVYDYLSDDSCDYPSNSSPK